MIRACPAERAMRQEARSTKPKYPCPITLMAGQTWTSRARGAKLSHLLLKNTDDGLTEGK